MTDRSWMDPKVRIPEADADLREIGHVIDAPQDRSHPLARSVLDAASCVACIVCGASTRRGLASLYCSDECRVIGRAARAEFRERHQRASPCTPEERRAISLRAVAALKELRGSRR